MAAHEPLSPARATQLLRSKCGPGLHLIWTGHAKERLRERGLIMGDVLYVLKHGHVYEEGQPSTRDGFFKYCMESATPNSNGRTVRIVVIPGHGQSDNEVKIVTVMWAD